MSQENQENWLDMKIIVAIRKMKIVGLKQALNPGILWVERLFWVAVFTICLGVAGYLTASTVEEYSQNPVLTTFREDEPIRKFPFPATTITGTTILNNNAIKGVNGLLRKEYEADVENQHSFQFEGQTWNSRLIDILFFTLDHLCELVRSFATRENILDAGKIESFTLRGKKQFTVHANVTLRDNVQDKDLTNTILPFLKNKTLDCTKIVAACYWEGNKENCTDIFVPTQSDVGSGCTFNRIPEKLLRKRQGLISIFHDENFTEEQIKDWESFELDSVISGEGMKNFPSFNNPKVQHDAGKLTGLSFMLIFDEDEGKACPIVDSRGYLIGIHSPFEEPRIMQTGITVPPKMEVFVKVKTEATMADRSIKSLSIAKRKCYFQVENPLRNFKHYTVVNCHQECLAREIRAKCSCLLLTQSVGQNEVLCGTTNVECVETTIASIRKVGYDQFCRNPICYSPCTELKYDADVSYLPYYEDNNFYSQRFLKKHFVTSIVHITQGSNSVPTRERKLQYSFSVLFGVIGGIWGMILEFSLFTMFNILAGFVALLIPKVFQVNKVKSVPECTQEASGTIAVLNNDQSSETHQKHTSITRDVSGDHSASLDDPGNSTSTDMRSASSADPIDNAQGYTTAPISVVSFNGTILEHEKSIPHRSLKQLLPLNEDYPLTCNETLFCQRNSSKWSSLIDETLDLSNTNPLSVSLNDEP